MESRPKYGYLNGYLVTDKMPKINGEINGGFVLKLNEACPQGINGTSNTNMECEILYPSGKHFCYYTINLVNLLELMKGTLFADKVCQSPVFFGKGGGLFVAGNGSEIEKHTYDWVQTKYKEADEKKKISSAVKEKSKGIKRWEPGRLFEPLEGSNYEVYLGKCKKIADIDYHIEKEFPYYEHMKLKETNEDMEIMINTLGCKSLKELLEKQIGLINTCINILNNEKEIYYLKNKLGDTQFYCSHLSYMSGAIYAMDAIGFHASKPSDRNVKATYLSKTKPKRVFHPEDTLKIDIPVNVYFSHIRMALQKLLDTHLMRVYKNTDSRSAADVRNVVYNYLVLSSAVQVELPGLDNNSEKSPKAMLIKALENVKNRDITLRRYDLIID